MRGQNIFLFTLLFCFFVCEAEDLTAKCSNAFTKLQTCLNYATGSATTPTTGCCTSMKDIKDSDPKCLCFIIQQTNNGSAAAKGLGIQEAKLLQLPSACALKNASLSDCPKLLGISPSAPDAAIFTNASSPATPVTATGTSSAAEKSESNGTKHGPYLVGPSVLIAMAIIFYGFPAGFASMLYI